MPTPLFYLFATIAFVGALGLIAFRNPVSSALSMVLSFVGFAALFIGLNAFFVGIIQILVYSGAIMVLFIFIIMLLDLQKEPLSSFKGASMVAGIIIPLIFLIQLATIIYKLPNKEATRLELADSAEHFPEGSAIRESLASNSLPDVNLIGQTLFTGYNIPLQVVGLLLLVATVGTVYITKSSTRK